MRKRSPLRVVACLAACLSGVTCGQAPGAGDQSAANAATASAHVLAVGDMAPDFSLPGSDGKQYSLASYRGQQSVVLAWFSKAFTEG
jgi:cytochrome oxidase Cu insertion factor (SCO1/SenC/PrrC family)